MRDKKETNKGKKLPFLEELQEEKRKKASAKGFCNTGLSERRLEGRLETKDLVGLTSWKPYERSVL